MTDKDFADAVVKLADSHSSCEPEYCTLQEELVKLVADYVKAR